MTSLEYVGGDLEILSKLRMALPDAISIRYSDHLTRDNAETALTLLEAGYAGTLDSKTSRRYIRERSAQGCPTLLVGNVDNELLARLKPEGCIDALSPPFTRPRVCAVIMTHLQLATTLCQLEQTQNAAHLKKQDGISPVLAEQEAIILCLASLARVRDHSTGNHILRSQHYVKALAEYLRYSPEFEKELDDDQTIELLYRSAALHDIGKVAVPDAILQKPATLMADEYEVMKQHPRFGFEALKAAEALVLNPSDGARHFFEIGQQITLCHHEHWDGSGYPQGLSGTDIPTVARIMAVADVYDAVVSRRPYKNAQSHNRAVELISAEKGTHFDPHIVEAFLDLSDTFATVAEALARHFPYFTDMAQPSDQPV